jgi:hypothetical protein
VNSGDTTTLWRDWPELVMDRGNTRHWHRLW